ncbi:MAG: hypothetical protein HUK02_08320 [Bacteroidaceae bacterium]|nr:hypothetical protein [Bacteroidaceae bacterium]
MKQVAFVLFALMGMSMMSCEPESKSARPPIYFGFQYEVKHLGGNAGDSLFVTAVQFKKGAYLNSTNYTFTLPIRVIRDGNVVDTTLTHVQHTNYDGTFNGNPVGKFHIPVTADAGVYNCKFSARFSNSADGEVGVTYQSMGGDTFLGTIRSTSYTLYSTADGSFNLRLPLEQ